MWHQWFNLNFMKLREYFVWYFSQEYHDACVWCCRRRSQRSEVEPRCAASWFIFGWTVPLISYVCRTIWLEWLILIAYMFIVQNVSIIFFFTVLTLALSWIRHSNSFYLVWCSSNNSKCCTIAERKILLSLNKIVFSWAPPSCCYVTGKACLQTHDQKRNSYWLASFLRSAREKRLEHFSI